ncbi:MAG: FkbM family methyltransferase [Acidobacteriota bacterium]
MLSGGKRRLPNRPGPWQRTRWVWRHPANRGRRWRAVLEGFGWMLYRHLFRSPRRRQGPGFLFYCYPDNAFCKRLILYNNLPDYHEMCFMRHYLQPGDGFLDIGANIGIYSLLAGSLVGERGRVDAFEPGPKAAERLRCNVRLNRFDDVVHLHRQVVSEECGTVAFVQDLDVGNRIQTEQESGNRALETECVALDRVVEGRSYAMAKVDVEGAEPLVLKGAEGLLAAANPPVWLLEVNGKLHDYGFTEEQLDSWLEAHGYGLAFYDSDRRRLEFANRLWERLSFEPGAGNLLAIHHASRSLVMERVSGVITSRS